MLYLGETAVAWTYNKRDIFYIITTVYTDKGMTQALQLDGVENTFSNQLMCNFPGYKYIMTETL